MVVSDRDDLAGERAERVSNPGTPGLFPSSEESLSRDRAEGIRGDPHLLFLPGVGRVESWANQAPATHFGNKIQFKHLSGTQRCFLLPNLPARAPISSSSSLRHGPPHSSSLFLNLSSVLFSKDEFPPTPPPRLLLLLRPGVS